MSLFYKYLEMKQAVDQYAEKLALTKTQAFKDYVQNAMRNEGVTDKDEFISNLLGNNSLNDLKKKINEI